MSIIIFLIVLAVLILVHEFGHFIVAKKSGIRVEEFGLGFPPNIWSKKWAGTLYSLNAIPFGGFVKIFGEDSHGQVLSDEEKKFSFSHKPKYIQAAVLVAGVTFNILFAWFLISFSYYAGVASPIEHSGSGKVADVHLTITQVLKDSPAEKAGIKSGDYIKNISVGSKDLTENVINPTLVQNLISSSKDEEVKITYVRGKSEPVTVSILPSDSFIQGKKAIGIAMDEIGILRLPVHLAVIEGAKTTYALTVGTAKGLAQFIGGVFTFHSDFSQVTGPIGIVGVVGDATKLGFNYLMTLTALISINLAIINLLPFPALDGGRLLFVAIEVISRKPISPKFVRNAHFVGFSALIILMIVVSVHDLLNFF